MFGRDFFFSEALTCLIAHRLYYYILIVHIIILFVFCELLNLTKWILWTWFTQSPLHQWHYSSSLVIYKLRGYGPVFGASASAGGERRNPHRSASASRPPVRMRCVFRRTAANKHPNLLVVYRRIKFITRKRRNECRTRGAADGIGNTYAAVSRFMSRTYWGGC